MTVKWLKKKKNCLLCQRLEASKAAQNLSEIWQAFGNEGHAYFALLVDRFITYTNKIGHIGSSATQPLVATLASCS